MVSSNIWSLKNRNVGHDELVFTFHDEVLVDMSVNYSVLDRVFFGCYAFALYLIKMVIPIKLIAFYTYPINTLAIAFFANNLTNKWSYIAPVLTFLIANLTAIKFASVSTFFEYGLVDLYWQ